MLAGELNVVVDVSSYINDQKPQQPTGTATWDMNLFGAITGTASADCTYAWEDLGGGNARIFGGYKTDDGSGNKIIGKYNAIKQGYRAGVLVSSTFSVDSGRKLYKNITDNGQPGTLNGTYDAAGMPTDMTFYCPNVTY